MVKIYILSFFSVLMLFINQAFAEIDDSVICLDAAARLEKEFNIPPYILTAIALTETGKKKDIEGQDFFTPTPWAINIEGKGYYFSSKADAMIKVKKALALGKKSIDVGCMQINLKYHGDAFASLEDAFNPYLNMRYAAEFVISLYERKKDWKKAVGHYHSGTPSLGVPYSDKVESNWERAASLLHPHNALFSYLNLQYKQKRPKPPSKQELYYRDRMKKIAQLRAEIRQNIIE